MVEQGIRITLLAKLTPFQAPTKFQPQKRNEAPIAMPFPVHTRSTGWVNKVDQAQPSKASKSNGRQSTKTRRSRSDTHAPLLSIHVGWVNAKCVKRHA